VLGGVTRGRIELRELSGEGGGAPPTPEKEKGEGNEKGKAGAGLEPPSAPSAPSSPSSPAAPVVPAAPTNAARRAQLQQGLPTGHLGPPPSDEDAELDEYSGEELEVSLDESLEEGLDADGVDEEIVAVSR
jgi:hypothetical protein